MSLTGDPPTAEIVPAAGPGKALPWEVATTEQWFLQDGGGHSCTLPKCTAPPEAQRSHHAMAHFCSRLNQQKEVNKEQTTDFKRWKNSLLLM